MYNTVSVLVHIVITFFLIQCLNTVTTVKLGVFAVRIKHRLSEHVHDSTFTHT